MHRRFFRLLDDVTTADGASAFEFEPCVYTFLVEFVSALEHDEHFVFAHVFQADMARHAITTCTTAVGTSAAVLHITIAIDIRIISVDALGDDFRRQLVQLVVVESTCDVPRVELDEFLVAEVEPVIGG